MSLDQQITRYKGIGKKNMHYNFCSYTKWKQKDNVISFAQLQFLQISADVERW